MKLSLLKLAAFLISLSPTIGVCESASVSLVKGWNLISIPVQVENDDISSVLTSLNGKYEAVYAFDNGTSKYKAYIPESTNELTIMRPGSGYWVYMKVEASLMVTGLKADNCLEVSPGWNLVGFNRLDSMPTGEATKSIVGKFSSIYSFDPFSKKYIGYIPNGSNQLTRLQPGNGYWIYFTATTSWCLEIHWSNSSAPKH
jgi:hypothetical protein